MDSESLIDGFLSKRTSSNENSSHREAARVKGSSESLLRSSGEKKERGQSRIPRKTSTPVQKVSNITIQKNVLMFHKIFYFSFIYCIQF